TPFGSRIHVPWAMAVTGRIRASGGSDVEAMWGDDGFVLRFPDSEEPPDSELILIQAEEATDLVLRQLGSTALFAAKFRESAARALLLPRRRADGRAPLWQQRRRAYDLLSVASRYPSFPIVLEAYRECLRDVFDMPALMETLRNIGNRSLRELMGDADLRELLDINAIEETEEQLQCMAETYRARNMDGVHDLLLRLGDLTRAELRVRCVSEEVADTVA